MRPKKDPHLYIDTNVFQDALRNREPKSIYLLQRIKDKSIPASTSAWTLLELLDISIENKHVWRRIGQGWSFDEILRRRYPRDLNTTDLLEAHREVDDKIYQTYFKSKIISLHTLDSEGWNYAYQLMGEYNISKGDAIHVASATSANCNVFVSSDSELLTLLNDHSIILSSSPEKLRHNLEVSEVDESSF